MRYWIGLECIEIENHVIDGQGFACQPAFIAEDEVCGLGDDWTGDCEDGLECLDVEYGLACLVPLIPDEGSCRLLDEQ